MTNEEAKRSVKPDAGWPGVAEWESKDAAEKAPASEIKPAPREPAHKPKDPQPWDRAKRPPANRPRREPKPAAVIPKISWGELISRKKVPSQRSAKIGLTFLAKQLELMVLFTLSALG